MLKVLILISLFISSSLFANEQVEQLKNIFDNEDNFSHELMWKSGRIGELHTSAKIVVIKDLAKSDLIAIVDKEIKNMDDTRELFRHKKGSINNLYSLFRNGNYDVVYKTGVSNNYPQYNSDGIHKDLISIMSNDVQEEVESKLKHIQYSYLRTWNTESEYDGMEKFFIKVGLQHVVIVTINNCGGC